MYVRHSQSYEIAQANLCELQDPKILSINFFEVMITVKVKETSSYRCLANAALEMFAL